MLASNEILKIYGTDYKEMTIRLLTASDLNSLILSRADDCGSANDFSSSASKPAAGVHGHPVRIGIKPNLVCPSPAEFGGTTHPEIVAGIIEYLRGYGFDDIRIVEGSWVGDRTSDAYEYCGYRSLCERYNVPFVDTQKLSSHEVDCAGMKLRVTDIVEDLDFLINVPVLKGHCQTKITCALKNMKGLLPNTEKRRFHQMGLHKPIAHLNTYLRPDFIVVDHICGDPDFEEGGNPLVRNCIMTALDPVLVDTYTCHLLGVAPSEVPYITLAASLGVGSMDLDNAKIRKICISEECGDPDPLTAADDEPPTSRELLDVSYAVDDADSCSACYGNLVPALYHLQDEGLLSELHEKIGIGQGHQKDSGRLGVGRCTKNYDYCIMGCPPDEEKIYEELKEYIRRHR